MAELNMLMLAVPPSKVYLGPHEGWKGPCGDNWAPNRFVYEVLDLKCGQILKNVAFSAVTAP